MRAWMAGAVVLAVAGASGVHAEPAAGRVRLSGVGRAEDGSASGGRVTGRVLASDAETLTIAPRSGPARTYRWNELRSFEESRGRRSRGAGALRGAGRGFLAGAAFGAIAVATYQASSRDPIGLDGLLVGAIAIDCTLGATVLGGAIGAIAPGERWSRVEVGRARVSVAPTTGPRGRGAGFAFAVEF